MGFMNGKTEMLLDVRNVVDILHGVLVVNVILTAATFLMALASALDRV